MKKIYIPFCVFLCCVVSCHMVLCCVDWTVYPLLKATSKTRLLKTQYITTIQLHAYIDFQLLRMRLRQKTYTSAKIMAKGLFLKRKYYDVWLDLPLVTECSKGLEEVESLIRKKMTSTLLRNKHHSKIIRGGTLWAH